MPERASPVWSSRESKRAREQLDALADNPRFDQVWIGVRWLILRNPIELGRLVPGKEKTYVLKTKDFLVLGVPVMLITYSIINADTRVLEFISIAPAADENKVSAPASAKPKTA